MKLRARKRNFRLGIVIASLFFVLLINMIFNIISPINSLLWGVFGLSTYAIFAALLIWGIALCCNVSVKLTLRQIAVLAIWLISFMMLLHLSTTTKILGDSFGEYLRQSYSTKLTAGGTFISILVYPLYYYTHLTGAFILTSILFVITTAFAIYSTYTHWSSPQKKKVEKEEKEEDFSYPEFYPVIEKEEDIVVEDDYLNESNSVDLGEIVEEESTKEKAKKLLGLKREGKMNAESRSINDLASSFNKAKSNGITKREYILTPKNTTVSASAGLNNRPPRFVHTLNKEEPAQQNSRTKKQLTEQEKKDLEFLRATVGHRGNIEEEETNYSRKPNLIREEESGGYDKSPTEGGYNTSFRQRKTIDEVYDDSLTINNYKERYSTKDIYRDDTPTTPIKSKYSQVRLDAVDDVPRERRARYKRPIKYIKPPVDLLTVIKNKDLDNEEDFANRADMLESTLKSFKIDATVVSVTRGPAFTRFELQMPPGVPVKRVLNYTDDLSMALESQGDVRVEVPIAGKNAFGVEVPNDKIATVGLRDIIESYSFQSNKSLLTFGLGKDITGDSNVARLDKMPHLLIAGSTGSGKSVCLNSLIISLMYKASPEQLRFILVDPKRVEFPLYNNMPHMLIPNVITDIEKALKSLAWAIDEMERRFEIFSQNMVKNLEEYTELATVQNGSLDRLPYIVIIVDELGDLMAQNKKDVEDKIIRLVQKSRAAGIHLVLATQRPSVNVITGTIKANLNSRIAFAVNSYVDSKTILDQAGAEKLLGKGDMLYSASDSPDLKRIQGAFISNKEIEDVVGFIKDNNEGNFDADIEDKMFNKKNNSYDNSEDEDFDVLLKDAVRTTIKHGNISISKIQRMFGVGYPRAGKIIDQMEKAGFISSTDNKNQRTVYITQQEFEERFGEDL